MPRKPMVSKPDTSDSEITATPNPNRPNTADEPAQAEPQAVGSRQPRATSREATGRRERIPLGTPRAKLGAKPIEGHHQRWINDTGTRLMDAQNAGYEFVTDDKGRKISRPVGTQESGKPMTAHLMKIKNEFYEEDQAVKQSDLDKIDDSIKRGGVKGADQQDAHGFYVPNEGITITRG